MRPGSTHEICDKTICGVVLAGGKSRRMGKNKSLISFRGKPLIEHVTDVLSQIFSEVVIVCDAQSHAENRFAHLPFPILCDQREALGPIAGIETALKTLHGKGIFVVAADMPFIKDTVIKEMCLHTTAYDLVIPKLGGRLHPLHAFYSAQCLKPITTAIHSNQLALHPLSRVVRSYFFPEKCFRKFDPTLKSVFNINTPEDLTTASALIRNRIAKEGI